MLQGLFDRRVYTLATDPRSVQGKLLPEESAVVANAVPKRQDEFRAGRLLARTLLARLAIHDFPLLAGEDRTPRWPAGVVGTISHCRGYCAVAIARADEFASLGVDVERSEPLKEKLIARVCTGSEREHMRSLPDAPPGTWEKLVFSAKESFYKCWWPLNRVYLGFQDAEIEFDLEAERFVARVVRPDATQAAVATEFSGRFRRDDRFIATGVARPAG